MSSAIVKTTMHSKHQPSAVRCAKRAASGFTLAEVVISIAIIAVVFGAILLAYNQATWRAEWTGYSLAEQSLATQQIEQARAAVWDPSITQNQPPGGRNEITNLTLFGRTVSGNLVKGYTTATLDLPVSTNAGPVLATNFVSIQKLNPTFGGVSSPGVFLHLIQVDTVWRFRIGQTNRLYTNSISTYLAPDNRDHETL